MTIDRAEIPVVILCGGLGTRLREETETRPKPMVEVGHAPVLWHIMKIYGHHGSRKFILCLGYKADVIKAFFRHFELWQQDVSLSYGTGPAVMRFHNSSRSEPWRVTLAETGAETMTGGRIKRIQHYVESDVFMATYGDGLADVDLAAELAFHSAHGKLATLTAARAPSRFGVLELDATAAVTSFREKPTLDEWVNGGFYVFNRRVFDFLDPDCVLERRPLAELAQRGELMAYRHEGSFQPMDTYRDVVDLNRQWHDGQAPWKVWTE